MRGVDCRALLKIFGGLVILYCWRNNSNSRHGTCDDPGVEVESHLAAVLEDDGLHQVAVPLQPDLVSLAPLPGVHQTCTNTNINMQRRLSSRFHTIGICKGSLLIIIMRSNNLNMGSFVAAKTNQPLVKIFSDTFIIVS